MNIDELKTILNNKMNALINSKGVYTLNGDLDSIFKIEKEIEELQLIIDKLAS